jgi:hypothetical protein
MDPTKLKYVYVDKVKRFAFNVDPDSGRTFVSFPVHNRLATYEEFYEIDRETFDRYLEDPTLADDFIARAKRRELDHLLLLKPGSDRGWPD